MQTQNVTLKLVQAPSRQNIHNICALKFIAAQEDKENSFLNFTIIGNMEVKNTCQDIKQMARERRGGARESHYSLQYWTKNV